MTTIQLAEVCYESVRACNRVLKLGAQYDWCDVDDQQKHGIENAIIRTLADPNDTQESNHEKWYKEMEAQGWRYGVAPNEELKEHPMMLPFNMLPKQFTIANKLHVAIVSALKEYIKPE